MAGIDTLDDDRIDRGEELAVTDADGSVVIAKIYTPKGERLEIRSATAGIRLDAIELECLSWQDATLFEEMVADAGLDPTAAVLAATGAGTGDDEDGGHPAAAGADAVRLSNEYSEVLVEPTAGDEALWIASEALHYETALRPIALEAVAAQDHALFSTLLNEPYGPMDR